ncbi:MAG: hypothetical protein MIO93_10515 [ANME-2 cluster archaeon]|jgi:hypothetical protein|nr:hypothetical protein [ANME-2 cluster archaeon]
MKVIMDSDSLIKLTKAKAKEIVVKNIEAYIPPLVFDETVKVPKKEGFPDAFLIEENVEKGFLTIGKFIYDAQLEEMINELGLGKGESDVFRLYKQGGFDVISSDDSKFLKIIDAFEIPYLTPTALIIYLFNKKVLTKEDAKLYINNLKEMISDEEYYLSIKEVE